MEPEDFLDPNNRVYREDQVITRNDLIMFVQLLEDQYEAISPKRKEERAHLLTSIKTVDTMLSWITMGKDREFRGLF
jgi:hypothetical protein